MSLDMKRRTLIPASYAARAGLEAVNALTFEVDPSVGAGHSARFSSVRKRSEQYSKKAQRLRFNGFESPVNRKGSAVRSHYSICTRAYA